MQGPVVDIVLLSLLILFFGRQQHSRPQKYYRLWFMGWISILLSYAVWEPRVASPMLTRVQNVTRYDLALLGLLCFLMSFLASRERLWAVVRKGLLVGLPAIASFDALEFFAVPKVVLAVAVVGWEAYGIRAAYVLIPKEWRRARLSIYAICILLCMVELWSVWRSGGHGLFDWALVEVAICSAALYMAIAGRRSVAALVGTFGFVLWAAFYAIGSIVPRSSALVTVVYLCWTLPKYFVAFSMILKTFEDETEEKARMAEDYRNLYDDFRMLYEGHPQPMWIYEAEGGTFLSANAAAVNQYGFSLDEILTMKPDEMFRLSEPERMLIESLYPGSALRFARHRYKDGRMIWATVDTHAIEFRGTDAVLISAWDVTEALESRRRLAHQANHDVLTGLPNRVLLADRIGQCMKRCEREGRKATLLMIDVDHFKKINDTYGHPAGDECLRIVAARLSSKIRQVDTIARVGGEEFAAIIGGLHVAEDAEKVAESLLRVFDEPLWLGEMHLSVTVSIGISIFPDDAGEVETLTRRADEALYAAKRAGRNRAVTSASLAVEQGMSELGAGVA
jgi:diguanylate cyclase (GGDEF)-like protein/PAS domain S-box-containing protein